MKFKTWRTMIPWSTIDDFLNHSMTHSQWTHLIQCNAQKREIQFFRVIKEILCHSSHRRHKRGRSRRPLRRGRRFGRGRRRWRRRWCRDSFRRFTLLPVSIRLLPSLKFHRKTGDEDADERRNERGDEESHPPQTDPIWMRRSHATAGRKSMN